MGSGAEGLGGLRRVWGRGLFSGEGWRRGI